jgi:CIC family chloride channel protein
MFLRIKDLVKRYSDRISLPEYTSFSFFAILIGMAVGLAAVFFHNAIDFFNDLFFEQTAEGLYFLGTAAVILLPAIGMLIQSAMIKATPEIAKKRGVAEVIKSVALRGGYIPLRTTLFHFIAPVICIGSGNTVGPEGPAAQLGGGVASKIGSVLKFSDSKRRMFTAAGAGAAISAIFNTPLGGIFFALEIVLLNDFHTPTFSALILASVTASAISRIFLGNTSVFLFSDPGMIDYSQLYLFIILGIFAGILSLLFINYSSAAERIIKKKLLKKMPQWLLMTSIGLLVGIAGYFYKDIFGIGYDGINHILESNYTLQIAAILLALKFILVPLVLYSGGFGGLFAPSLFMGACFGYIFSITMNNLFGLDLNPTVFILVSMGAVLGGINSIPISSILIIFEMTKDYSFILPLMLAVVVSTMLVQLKLKGSIHVKHLEQQGFNISHGRETNILRSIRVEDVMNTDIILVSEKSGLASIVTNMIDNPRGSIYIVNDQDEVVGMITESELRPIITEYEHLREMVVAKDIMKGDIKKVDKNQDLDFVMKMFEKARAEEFPVVDTETNKILGTISRHDLITAYNRESLKYNLAGGLAQELKTISPSAISNVAEGYSIAERNVKSEFVGKSLAELRIRNRFGLEILMIKKVKSPLEFEQEKSEILIPKPDYIIKENDKLVIFGEDDKIKETEDW